MHSPLATVIIPFYNAQQTIGRAIESISKQTYTNFECILVNNNSTDNSRKIAESIVLKDTRFWIIEENKQGVMFASNTGAKAAKGKYIARMDADDWSFPDRLEKQVHFLENNLNYGAVAGLAEHIGNPETTAGFSRYVDWSNSVQTYEELTCKQFIEMPLVNPTAMWRKETGEKYGLYKKGNFPEDYEMWLRWLSKGVKIKKLPEPVLKWYDSPTRLTRTQEIYSDKSFYKIKSQYLAMWLEKNNPFYPNVVVWGASKISRRRAKLLVKHGIEITAYIDIKRSRQIDKEIIFYQEIPSPKKIFVLVYIKQMDAREEIQEYLHQKGFVEGVNYLLIS